MMRAAVGLLGGALAAYDDVVVASTPIGYWPLASTAGSIFEDLSGNNRDLTITTAANWTIHTGDLPNGDNSASLSTSLNENARWNGEEFCIPTGSGTEALTIEAWVKVTANTNSRAIVVCRTNGTATTTVERHYSTAITTSEGAEAVWFSTTATFHFAATTSALAAGWHHIVMVFRGGSSRGVVVYIDGVSAASDLTATDTATTAASATYVFYLGAGRTNATFEMTDHMAKVAVYDRELTSGEITAHYNAMYA